MQTHIQKWGNSLGVRIPATLSKRLHLKPGSTVDIDLEGERLVIQAPSYNLQEMVQAITKQNMRHVILDDEETVGDEAW